MRKKILTTIAILIFVFPLTLSLLAQEQDETFYGSFNFGYRMVDRNGTLDKYKEDINLDDGARLFNFSLHFTPVGTLKNLFDRIDLNLYNFGGDPYETLGLSIQKYGKYKFKYDRRKSTYFYSDQLEASAGTLYDFHTFNFDRISDSGSLNYTLHDNVNLFMNFDRYTKKGDSVTTFDIGRIEFEFDKPIREESKEVTFGADIHIKNYSVVYEERIQDYETTNSMFLPGYADGGAGASYPSSLSLFNLNQPYDLKTRGRSIRFNARPFSDLLVTGSYFYSSQDMALTYSEDADGIDYTGNPFAYSYSGTGSFERKISLYDLDVSYLLFNKLAVIGGVRYNTFTQDGILTIDSVDKETELKFDTLLFEGGLQYQLSSTFALTLGYRNEARTLENMETVTFEEKTKRNGYFGNLKWDFSNFKFTADYQRSYYDDPFTLISPTGADRFRVTARFREKRFNISGSWLKTKSKSEIGDDLWESSKNQIKLRAGYTAEKYKIFAGYSRISTDHTADRTIAYPPSWSGAGGTFPWNIDYSGKSQLFDCSFSLNLTEKLKLGAYGNIYKNDSKVYLNNNMLEISRTTTKWYLDYSFDDGFIVQLAHRYVEFKEKSSAFNDYRANIFEISFGYRWQ